jgi:hypothetical protein
MDISDKISGLLSSKRSTKETYLTLLINQDHIAGACWHLGKNSQPELTHAVARRIENDNWDERTLAADEVVSALEERAGTEKINKAIYGLPNNYLTETGDLSVEIRNCLKKFSKNLSLTPIGFVPINQAIVHVLQREEGVPPSLILIGVTKNDLSLSHYQQGKLIGQIQIVTAGNIPEKINEALDEISGKIPLPSRVILYGIDSERLEDLKSECTRFSWTNQGNFLHLPKFQILSPDTTVASVSIAGAGEIAKSMEFGVHSESGTEEEKKSNETEISDQDASAVADLTESQHKLNDGLDSGKQKDEKKPRVISSVVPVESDLPEVEKKELTEHKKQIEPENDYAFEEAVNVQYVAPEAIGFQPEKDIIEVNRHSKLSGELDRSSEKRGIPIRQPEAKIPEKITETFTPETINEDDEEVSVLNNGTKKRISIPVKIILTAIAILLILLFALGYLIIYYPSAQVNINLKKDTVGITKTLTFDPDINNVDTDNLILPVTIKEATVSGENTVQTSGKKKVGDPAKGIITIYNKSLTARVFKKGQIIQSGSLSFSLDEEVKVASASESIGSITFGKSNANVTATVIGAAANLSAGAEFNFKDISASVAIARNESAFTGGTSRDVVVVSRTDYDAIIEKVKTELTQSANNELTAQIGAQNRLIEQTVKTEIISKSFSKEIDEESESVSGKITLRISGLSYTDSDIRQLFSGLLLPNVPQGYELAPEIMSITLEKTKSNKDGTVTADVKVETAAKPKIDLEELTATIAGKSQAEAVSLLKGRPGIASVTVKSNNPIFRGALPRSLKKIRISFEANQ